jgi:hypothetical protein
MKSLPKVVKSAKEVYHPNQNFFLVNRPKKFTTPISFFVKSPLSASAQSKMRPEQNAPRVMRQE